MEKMETNQRNVNVADLYIHHDRVLTKLEVLAEALNGLTERLVAVETRHEARMDDRERIFERLSLLEHSEQSRIAWRQRIEDNEKAIEALTDPNQSKMTSGIAIGAGTAGTALGFFVAKLEAIKALFSGG